VERRYKELRYKERCKGIADFKRRFPTSETTSSACAAEDRASAPMATSSRLPVMVAATTSGGANGNEMKSHHADHYNNPQG
jgi:hypothetical protein